jgi:DNA-binding XRE family transcriptional regulator
LGYAAGNITIAGFSLGVGAVLFVGLMIGVIAPKSAPPGIVGTMGLVLFLYGIGIQYIEKFAQTFGRNLPRQIRMARAWFDWSREDLALRAQVSVSTIRRFERENFNVFRASLPAILKVVQTLEEYGVVLKDPDLKSGLEGGIEFVGMVDTIMRLDRFRWAHRPLEDAVAEPPE